MTLEWIHEVNPRWDEPKAAILGGAPAESLAPQSAVRGDLVPGDWFRVEEAGRVVGYGWMDCTWGDAEVLLAVDPSRQRAGIGSFILDHLEQEAAARGLNYTHNAVRATHPHRAEVTRWLEHHGFIPSGDGLLKRRVRRP